MANISTQDLEHKFLDWYDQHQRTLPWRARPGERPNPYHVWLSEIMLQQTTVQTVIPYFEKFVKTYPTLQDLARTELDDVLVLWQGLGYYSRAKNLKKCAETLVSDHNAKFPQAALDLIKLPGIGSYTSAAIAAIAFDESVLPVDGNIIRVISRVRAIKTPLPELKQEVESIISEYVPSKRSGDFAQALMDLGATVCKPTKPDCDVCPWQNDCQAHALGQADILPRKKPKTEKPTRYAVAFLITNNEGAIYLRKRGSKGLLANMIEVPSTEWGNKQPETSKAANDAPVTSNDWQVLEGEVKHTFTHFHFKVRVLRTNFNASPEDGFWAREEDLPNRALPTLMKKILRHGNISV